MRTVSALFLVASLSTVLAKPNARIKNLVVLYVTFNMPLHTFNSNRLTRAPYLLSGDSYSDVDYVWDGGLPWPDYAALYANWTRYGFARSGGTCSNAITYRPSPPVVESQVCPDLTLSTSLRPSLTSNPQIPDYKASNLSATLNMRETLFTIWIGTNDGRFFVLGLF